MSASVPKRRAFAWGNMIEAHYAGHVAVRVPGRIGCLSNYLVDGRYTIAARHALDALEIASRITANEKDLTS